MGRLLGDDENDSTTQTQRQISKPTRPGDAEKHNALEEIVFAHHQDLIKDLKRKKDASESPDVSSQTGNAEESEGLTAGHDDGRDDESTEEAKDPAELDFGLIHKIFKKCFSLENATVATILVMAVTSIVDLTSSLGLVGLLSGRTFTSEAVTIILVEYSAVPAVVAHYINQKKKSDAWTTILPELAILVIFPVAPSVGYLFWVSRICLKRESDRVHKFCTLCSMIRGVLISPFMVAATSWLYLTDCITPPWYERTTFCDSMSNCLPLGPFATLVPLIRFGLSLLTVFTGFLDARQATDKFQTCEFLAFAVPNCIYRVSTLILTATALKEYAIYLLIPVLAVNVVLAMLIRKCEKDNAIKAKEKEKHYTKRNISSLTSALTSLVGIGIIPEDPTEKEKNAGLIDSPENLKKVHRLAATSSMATLPCFLLTNVALHLLILSSAFDTNPNNALNNNQMLHVLRYGLYPLAAATLVTTMIFGSAVLCSARKGVRWLNLTINLITTLFTIGGLIAVAVTLPAGPSKVVLAIQTRDRVNFVEGFTWNKEWDSSTNEWNMINGKLVSLDKRMLKEVSMSYPQNLNTSETDVFCSRTKVSNWTEENSRIRLVKPYPPSTDNTTDANCVSCPDNTSNYCRRLTQEVVEKNPHLGICTKAVDGWWTSWKDGPCRAVREVPEGVLCGKGWQMKTRECEGRKSGGKYCTGKVSSHKECLEKPCPGKIIVMSPGG